MSIADDLRKNFQPLEKDRFFCEARLIVRNIVDSARAASFSSHSLSGYYSWGGYEEGSGLYAYFKTRENPAYFHIEDFGTYREGILANSKGFDRIYSVADTRQVLNEIRQQLIALGFRNVIVEEKKIDMSKVVYARRNKTILEKMRNHVYDSKTMPLLVEMPRYMLYVSISW